MSTLCLAAGDIYVAVKIEEDNIYEGITKVLQVIRSTWPPENIKYKKFTDGITNKLVACQLDNNTDDIVLVRIYGNKTDLIIDRTAELRNIKVLNKLGLAPKIYGVFQNGLAYEYYPGVTLTVESVRDSNVWPLVARQMAKMHKVELGSEVTKEPMLWDKAEQFLALLPTPLSDEKKQQRFANSFGSITKLRIEFERLKSHLNKSESPIVFAHNDLLLGNVIFKEDDGTVAFIDYEYATYNYQAYDIANHFNEFAGISLEDIDVANIPSKEFQLNWIRVYLSEYFNREPTDEEVILVYNDVEKMTLASNFFWGIWALVQLELSHIDFDFGGYAEIRLKWYFDKKDQILKDLS